MTPLERIVEALPLTWPDVLALLLLVAVWVGYQWHADYSGTTINGSIPAGG